MMLETEPTTETTGARGQTSAPSADPRETPRRADSSSGAGVGHLADFLPYQLSITSNAVSDLIAERYRTRFGLKVTEWRVMAVLGDLADETGMTQRALTQATRMDKVAVNRACKVLEERGLVARAPNASDGRSHLLVLTDKGRSIHGQVMPLALATQAELFDGFSPADAKRLHAMLTRLRDRVEHLSTSID